MVFGDVPWQALREILPHYADDLFVDTKRILASYHSNRTRGDTMLDAREFEKAVVVEQSMLGTWHRDLSRLWTQHTGYDLPSVGAGLRSTKERMGPGAMSMGGAVLSMAGIVLALDLRRRQRPAAAADDGAAKRFRQRLAASWGLIFAGTWQSVPLPRAAPHHAGGLAHTPRAGHWCCLPS